MIRLFFIGMVMGATLMLGYKVYSTLVQNNLLISNGQFKE